VGIAYELFQASFTALNRVLKRPFSYTDDGLYTMHNADFLNDPRFVHAYRLATATDHGLGKDLHIEWRVHVCCWAATQALQHEGDFVECGVNSGIYSRAVADYVAFETLPRRFFLMDTFAGIPKDQFVTEERGTGLHERYVYKNQLESVRAQFATYPNVEIVAGRIPETLAAVTPDKVAYLSIDMNAVVPEIAAAEHFWERLVSGAVIVLDDYGFHHHIVQKNAFDAFAKARGVSVMSLPTGQGIIVKP
jgi:O-methyltransferase